MARICSHCGVGFAEGSIHICKEPDFEKNLRKAMNLAEGAKYDTGKPDFSLLPPDALEEVVRVYDFGVRKYARDNWRKGIKYSRIFGAIMRHLYAWWRCEDRDKESGLRHLAQAAWGCFTLLEYTKNDEYAHFDDRTRPWNGGIIVPPEEANTLRKIIEQQAQEKTSVPTELCSHDYEAAESYSDKAGLHTWWCCKKCGHKHQVNDPPISIPTCWTTDPNPVPYTITVTAGAGEGDSYLVMPGGVLQPIVKTGDGPRPEKRKTSCP